MAKTRISAAGQRAKNGDAPPVIKLADQPLPREIHITIPGRAAPPPSTAKDYTEYGDPYKGLPSTIRFLFLRVKGGADRAVRFACYGSKGDDRAEAIAAEFLKLKWPKHRDEFSFEDACKRHGLVPSEYVGMVVAGMSQFREDYEAIIKAQEVPEVLEKSMEFSKKEANFAERHETLKAAGHHLAPKAAQVMVDNRDQRQQIIEMGLPTMEDGLRGFEEIGQRRLPPTQAVEAELVTEEKEPANVVAATNG